MSSITNRLRTQLVTRLSDVTTGFNATYNAAATSTYPTVPANSNIDFTGAGHNFFMAQVDPATLTESTSVTYPVMCVYGTTGEDTNEQKFQLFSGDVTMVIDYHISSKHSKVQYDYESPADCVEDTMIQIANRTANQNWDFQTVYNGNIAWVRGGVKVGAGSFRQSLKYIMKFQVQTL